MWSSDEEDVIGTIDNVAETGAEPSGSAPVASSNAQEAHDVIPDRSSSSANIDAEPEGSVPVASSRNEAIDIIPASPCAPTRRFVVLTLGANTLCYNFSSAAARALRDECPRDAVQSASVVSAVSDTVAQTMFFSRAVFALSRLLVWRSLQPGKPFAKLTTGATGATGGTVACTV